MAEAITIRAATPSDAPILCELLTQLGYPASEAEIPARLSAVASFPRAAAFVATNGFGEVVGLVTTGPRQALVGRRRHGSSRRNWLAWNTSGLMP